MTSYPRASAMRSSVLCVTPVRGGRAGRAHAVLPVADPRPGRAPGDPRGPPGRGARQLGPPLAERPAGAGRLRGRERWPELVERVRTGRRAWSRPGSSRSTRSSTWPRCSSTTRTCCGAQPGWEPRPLPDDLEQGLWSALTRTGRLLFRRSPVGVVLVTPAYGRRLVAHAARGRRLRRAARHPRRAPPARLGPAGRRAGHWSRGPRTHGRLPGHRPQPLTATAPPPSRPGSADRVALPPAARP